MDAERLKALREKALAAMHDLGVSDNESERDLATELAIYHAELEAQHAELMEANLRISEHVQELTALFDEAPVAYFVLDNGIVVRRWNGAATPLSTHGILTPGVFFYASIYQQRPHHPSRVVAQPTNLRALDGGRRPQP